MCIIASRLLYRPVALVNNYLKLYIDSGIVLIVYLKLLMRNEP